MGAFFLFKKNEMIDKKSVREVFKKKGFLNPRIFNLDSLTLWLFKKQLVETNNYIISHSGDAIFVTGTLVYKKKSYRESLIDLFSDLENNKLSYDELFGIFCIIYFSKGRVHLLIDHGNIYRVYINKAKTILSSSFLSLLFAQGNNLHLNRYAFFEQLATGFVTGPDTLVEDISLINNTNSNNINSNIFSYLGFPNNNEKYINYSNLNFEDSVKNQISKLRNYYQHITPLALQYGVDIGLSGGYDSRLNLLLSEPFKHRITTHTHCSQEHKRDKNIASIIAEKMNIPLKIMTLSNPLAMNEDQLLENLDDSFYFFDGLTNHSMGSFNNVHTRSYRVLALGDNKLGLNGFGGELFRNYDYTFYHRNSFLEYLKYHIIKPNLYYSINSSQINELLNYISYKYLNILKLSSINYVDRYDLRKFYAEVFLPYSVGIKSQAENQLSFFLMPFTEYKIRRNAVNSTPIIGLSGKYESSMILNINPYIATLPSIYGFSLDNQPVLSLAKSFVRCIIPFKIKNISYKYRQKYLYNNNQYNYHTYLEKHKIVKQCIGILKESGIPIDWKKLITNKIQFERSVFMGYFLNKLSGKICR